MKKNTLLLAVLIASACYANAQSNWSVGFRTGVEPINPNYLGGNEEIRLRFNQQFFLTKRVYKNLEVEINCSYKNPVSLYSAGQIYDGPNFYSNNTTSSSIEFGFAIRYFVMRKKGWSPYLVAGIMSSTDFTKTNSFYEEMYTGKPIYDESKSTRTEILSKYCGGIGVNKSLSKNWFLNTQITIDYLGMGFSYSNEFTPKLQIGLAYCW